MTQTNAFPAEWGWAKLHQKSAGFKAFGYYYRDRTAGPSFKILVQLTPGMDDATAVAAAHAAGLRAPSTFRLGAHETLGSDGLPEEVWAMLRASFEAGQSANPNSAIVLRLSPQERTTHQLPDAPPGMEHYL